MANKTVEKISPDTFLNEMNAINDKTKDAVIDLLSKQGDKRYIAVPDWEDECEGDDGDGTEVSIFGIGLDDMMRFVLLQLLTISAMVMALTISHRNGPKPPNFGIQTIVPSTDS